MKWHQAYPDKAAKQIEREAQKRRGEELRDAMEAGQVPDLRIVIVSLVREVRGTQFKLWDEPTQSWLRARSESEAAKIWDAMDSGRKITVTVEGKMVKAVEFGESEAQRDLDSAIEAGGDDQDWTK